MSHRDYPTQLAARGRYHFTTEQAASELGISPTAARAALRRLRDHGAIATPFRGFHVVVPPEYQTLRCLPPEQFVPQLMQHLGVPCYAGLLSAARYHGAAHQQPQVFQVVVPTNRLRIVCGQVHVAFAARGNAEDMPTVSFNTPRGRVVVSTPEATAYDLVGYERHCGGLSNVTTLLSELSAALDPQQLVQVAPLSPLPWTQRLGFLLEAVGTGDPCQPLHDYVVEHTTSTTPLSPGRNAAGAPRDPRWKLLVNDEVEPEG
ncbi:MAG: type IV toxin-antitoxin system AbiEi family antitoxin [Chloroflexi bacterium]|nr:type IV toxin-antitoxin system AbiEi family antitoxin [Chloroflexota bacterium]